MRGLTIEDSGFGRPRDVSLSKRDWGAVCARGDGSVEEDTIDEVAAKLRE